MQRKTKMRGAKIIFNKRKFLPMGEMILSYFFSGQLPPGSVIVKEDKSRVVKFPFAGKFYFLKLYTKKRPGKTFKNIFRKPEGIRQFRIAQRLQKHGIPAAPPVLAVSRRTKLIFTESAWVTEALPGENLHKLFQQYRDSPRRKYQLIREYARTLAVLFRNNFLHRDPIPANFIVVEENKELKIFLIDLEHVYSLPFLEERIFFSNLAKFNDLIFHLFPPGTKHCPSLKERIFFFRELKENLGREEDLREFFTRLNRATLKRFKKKKRKNFLQEDVFWKNYLCCRDNF